jgi:chromosome segregation ATPase
MDIEPAVNESTTDPAPGIVFDTGSGISEAEQREILAGIEQAVRQDRRGLRDEALPVRAKKQGLLFPVLVNVAALLLLGIGVTVILLIFRGSGETQNRRGAMLYNSAERALIREIRLETAREVESKEQEINQIQSKLAGVDAELQDLYSSNQELTAEQKAVEADLQHLQEEYRTNLTSLQDDRSRILEASRAREANMRAQFDARASELSAQAAESQEALSGVRLELDRLSTDQEKGAVIEAQLSGLYSRAASQINSGQLKEATATLKSMRDFINTPAFQGIRSLQPRRAFYLSSIGTLEGLITLAEKLNDAVAAAGGAGPIADYEKTIADLETQNAALQEQVAASGADSTGFGRQLDELRTRISGLQTQAEEQERTIADQTAALAEQTRNLEAERNSNTALESRNRELTGEVAELNRTIAERNASIETLTAQNADQAANIQSLNSQLTTIRQVLQGDQQ